MHAASDGAITESMGYFDSGFYKIGGQEVYVSRTGWTAELGYEVYAEWDRIDCDRLWRHLVEAGTPHGMIVDSLASMEIRRIEAGILDNGSDMDMTTTPFQCGLGAFVDMDKGDFIGRSALAKADRRNLLFGFKCGAAAPSMGNHVIDNGKVVGRCTAGFGVRWELTA
jgi:glycine cleavage system aminomethyltransferase T